MATYNTDKWNEWMNATLTGDANAYRLLLVNLQGWLTAYFRKRVHQNIVEDLVQDTLMTLHAKKQTYDPSYPFGPWIAAVARHRWIDHMRKTLKYVVLELDENIATHEQTRDECAKHDVRTLLKLIPSAQAEIIDMMKLQEMSVDDIAKKTGHSTSSVKIMVHRGMRQMMSAVQKAEK